MERRSNREDEKLSTEAGQLQPEGAGAMTLYRSRLRSSDQLGDSGEDGIHVQSERLNVSSNLVRANL